ncbi:hypothetical protein N1851_029887 [Merluccius polli]|uniref:Alkylated DNA repair protein AlkB homologue 8 N-terminal domain-containing protein n=1 Tax=Merluccius polli TaxID=89951 RepID=A0AA47M6C2_MERPO|nr:hypothetical protein N1851_029887 [Merluccius polli]
MVKGQDVFLWYHQEKRSSFSIDLGVEAAFNTVILALLQDKLSQLHTSCLTGAVKLGKHTCDSRTISTGSPQGCVLSPLLFSLYTNSCTSNHQWEIDHLATWCSQKNLELNALKTVEMVVDIRENAAPPAPITLGDSPVNTVEFCFLGSIISQELKWKLNISSLIKKEQQMMYFPQQLKKFNLQKKMMVHFYTAIIESILTSSITIYAAATAKDKGRLQRIIHSAEKVIGCNLPSLQELYASRTLRRAGTIVANPSYPGHKLFE